MVPLVHKMASSSRMQVAEHLESYAVEGHPEVAGNIEKLQLPKGLQVLPATPHAHPNTQVTQGFEGSIGWSDGQRLVAMQRQPAQLGQRAQVVKPALGVRWAVSLSSALTCRRR